MTACGFKAICLGQFNKKQNKTKNELVPDPLVQTKLPLLRLLISPSDSCFMFPCMSSDTLQEKGSLEHLCCDYREHDFSSPSSKDLHSIHSYSKYPDCFHIHVGIQQTHFVTSYISCKGISRGKIVARV